jgi:para-aminobenzoate synthetase component 1
VLVERLIFPPKVSFGVLQTQLSQHFGFVYLQDQQASFFACLPKQLQRLDQDQIWQRQADGRYQCSTGELNPQFQTTTTPTDTADLSFQGGYVAFIGYDYAAAQHLAGIPKQAPSAIIAEYDLIIKRHEGHWRLYCSEAMANLPCVLRLIDALLNCAPQTAVDSADLVLAHPMRARWSKQQYLQAFGQVQDYLHAGDCYQVNLTQEFYSQIQSGRLLTLLPGLLSLSQAPFAAYMAFEQFELLSCSPELFIQFNASGELITRPIKGTIARDADPIADQQAKQQLADSAKDQAENLMIVDLLRNDLGLYAKTGSVQVPQLFAIESFAQVHHMVSEIRAQLKPGVNPWQVLLAALPGGSITGAPKIRAMQIIQQIEAANRGAYCGSIGYFNYDGSGRFNILIRSLQRYQQRLSVWAGGGITVASKAEDEYQECLDKVSALLAFLDQHQHHPQA